MGHARPIFVEKPMIRHALIRSLILPVLLTCAVRPVLADGLPSQFTLSKAVPDDVFMVVNGAYNEEHVWMQQQWDRVFKAFHESGIIDDVLKLVTSKVPADKRAAVDETITQFSGLFSTVDWGAIAEREMVFAESFAGSGDASIAKLFVPSYMFLARGRSGTGEANVKALLTIINHLTALTEGKVQIETGKLHGVDVWSLSVGEKIGFRFDLFRHGDVIGLVFGSEGADKVIGLLTGKGTGKSIVDSPRFKAAYASISKRITPEDMVMFVDIKGMLGKMRGMIDVATAEKKEDPKVVTMRGIMFKAMDMLDVMDYSVTAMATDGQQEKTYALMKLQDGKSDFVLCKMMTGARPIEKFHQFIPVDATNFSAGGSINLELLYNTAIEFVRKEIPEGEGYITQWNEILASVGFDPQRDVFSWFSGETISITMPPSVVSGMGGADSVSFIRVKNPELAKQKIDALIAFVNGKIKELPQEMKAKTMGMASPLNFSPASQVNAEGFKELQHPMLMMMGGLRPVMGFTGNWLVLGNSAAAVNRCLAVASGEAKSIRDNPRFMAEGLIPDGACMAVSFTDTSNFGQELAAGIGMIGMMGPMIVGMIPEEKGLSEIKPMLMKVFGILAKLSPVLQQIDFYSSEAGLTTVKGNEVWVQNVVTYKPRKTVDAR